MERGVRLTGCGTNVISPLFGVLGLKSLLYDAISFDELAPVFEVVSRPTGLDATIAARRLCFQQLFAGSDIARDSDRGTFRRVCHIL